VLPSFEKTVEWWILISGLWMRPTMRGLAGSSMLHICDSVRHAAAASLRSRKSVTSWQPMVVSTGNVLTSS
jgi:hypothetical protein